MTVKVTSGARNMESALNAEKQKPDQTEALAMTAQKSRVRENEKKGNPRTENQSMREARDGVKD